MTPDSKKKTTAKNPAKERVTKKTAAKATEAPAKKVAKKTAVKTREAPAKKVAKKSTITTKPHTTSINITSEERWKLVAIAAYHKAEKRGFAPGSELQDWAEAEQEIDELLMSG
jgi:Protein of unknown function (DUF2934)